MATRSSSTRARANRSAVVKTDKGQAATQEQAAEVPVEEGATRYRVRHSAINAPTEPGNKGVLRYQRGQIVDFDPEIVDVDRLLGLGAIEEYKEPESEASDEQPPAEGEGDGGETTPAE